MRHGAVLALVSLLVTATLPVAAREQTPSRPALPLLILETAKGTIEIELFPDEAPKSVGHITALVKQGFYRGLRFHWVNSAVAQVGDPASRDMTKKASWGAGNSGTRIGVAEFSKRKFVRGSVGIAHRDDVLNSDSQIFISKVANPALDGKYNMIGRVIRGMDVVDKIQMADVLKSATLK